MSANASSLSEYLEQLPGTTFRRLYQQPSAAFAIFRRMLPNLGKAFCPQLPCFQLRQQHVVHVGQADVVISQLRRS